MTRIANLLGRAALLTEEGAVDIERASDGRFASDVQALYERWEEFLDWAAEGSHTSEELPAFEFQQTDLLSPAPRPTQVFGIGLNYKDHAEETGAALPERLAVFTKYPTCITGGFEEVCLVEEGEVDWEVELVVVMGRRAHRVADWEAWSHVAGLCVGTDFSERRLQYAAGRQFSLGKSYPGFGPMGPWLVTPDELTAPDDLALSCLVNDEVMQSGRTAEMIFPVPRIIEEISAVVPLLPGDVIFTGTPAGVGRARGRYLRAGDTVTCSIEGIGSIVSQMIAP